MPHHQRGIALISVLLVMTLALLITAGMVREHRLLVRSSAWQLQALQLRQWALSAEQWAQGQLPRQAGPVTLDQPWAQVQAPWAPASGQLEVVIEDLAGRANQPAAGHPGLTSQASTAVAHLPPHAGLNINTAGLAAMQTAGLAPEVARQLIANRPAQGYTSVTAALGGQAPATPVLSISSRWFQVRARASIGGRGVQLISDFELERNSRRPVLRQRRLLPFSETGEHWP